MNKNGTYHTRVGTTRRGFGILNMYKEIEDPNSPTHQNQTNYAAV